MIQPFQKVSYCDLKPGENYVVRHRLDICAPIRFRVPTHFKCFEVNAKCSQYTSLPFWLRLFNTVRAEDGKLPNGKYTVIQPNGEKFSHFVIKGKIFKGPYKFETGKFYTGLEGCT